MANPPSAWISTRKLSTSKPFSPAAVIGPGERTGEFRIGGDQLLADESGESRISIPDFAIAFVDEIEHGDEFRRRITVAY